MNIFSNQNDTELSASETKQTTCATRLKALADDTRLSVVQALMKGDSHVGELMDSLGIEQSLLSHHLRALRDAGLVQSERDGKSVLYRLAPGVDSNPEHNAIELGCCQLSFESE